MSINFSSFHDNYLISGTSIAGVGLGLFAASKLLSKKAKSQIVKLAAVTAITAVALFAADYLGRYTASCEYRLERAKADLLECPAAKERWDEVWKSGGPFTVQCGNEGTFVYPELRQIFINRNSHRPIVSAILFEVNNLRIDKKFKESFLRSDDCDSIDCIEWANMMEKIESETEKETHRIATQCVRQGIWPPAWNEHADRTNYTLLETSGHTQHYREWCLNFLENHCNRTVENPEKILRPYLYSPQQCPRS